MHALTAISLLLVAFAGCTHSEPGAEADKGELRSAVANGKADEVYGAGDFCEEYGWYDDMECDDFCPSPDPDCAVCRLPGEACDESECGVRPEFSPRPCPDGSFIYGSSTCIDTGGSCDWAFDAPECPALEEGSLCDESFCTDPRPALSARPCHDGTFVYGTTDCRAGTTGECGWAIGNTECPACDESECGPEPSLSPRPCPDGSFIYASATCADDGVSCGWEIDAPACPVLEEGTLCDDSFCTGPMPALSARPCHDGTFVYGSADCRAGTTGECGWAIGNTECPACDDGECGPRPSLSPRRCPDGSMIYASSTCADDGVSCDWEINAPACPAMDPGTPCADWACGDAPSFEPRLCCDGSTAAPPTSCEADATGSACEWVVGAAVCG